MEDKNNKEWDNEEWNDIEKNYINHKKSRRKSDLIKILIGILLILILANIVVFYQLFNHKAFYIKYVEVISDGNIGKYEIFSYIKPEEYNSNILLFDAEKAKKDLEENELIISAKIEKEYPDKINIYLEEIYVIGYIQRDDNLIYIDQDGNLTENFELVNETQEKDELLYEIGIDIEGDKLDQKYVDFIKEVDKYSFSSDISKINFEKDDSIDIIYRDISIFFENMDTYQEKIRDLDRIIADISGSDLKVKAIYMDRDKRPIVVTEKKSDQEGVNE